ncbi:hypothetical protein V5O48_003477 [Marasmius crinis-equi]|uniref:N-acetyltransferase domain-containing protein n=1 Tax=Marasmius crinis-equi TaxID=585013 RepID=A0ABR3FST2_9AGAR
MLTSTLTYHLHALSQSPPAPAEVERYKQFRLLSLRTDPQAYSSAYAKESAFTDQQWHDRLAPTQKITIVASTDEHEWGGMITVLSPQFFDFTEYIPSKLKETHRVDSVYVFVGMWVHPDHRQRGVGTLLVQEAVRWVQKQNAGNDGEERRGTALLEVVQVNQDAARLYRRMGFQEVDRAGSYSQVDSLFMFLDIERETAAAV